MTERSTVRAMCGEQLKEKQLRDLILGLNETMDQTATINNICWYGHMLRKEDGQVLMALDFEVE